MARITVAIKMNEAQTLTNYSGKEQTRVKTISFLMLILFFFN